MSLSERNICVLYHPVDEQPFVSFFNLSAAKNSSDPSVKKVYRKVCDALKADGTEEVDYETFEEALNEPVWSSTPCYVQEQVTLYDIE